jgi:hypothetical protein
MSSTMVAAIFGLAGVVVGGLLTAGFEQWRDHTNRRLDARTAARMLYMKLFEARVHVDATLAESRMRLDMDWRPYLEAWNINQKPLARQMESADEFMQLSAAFTAMRQISERQAILSEHEEAKSVPIPPDVSELLRRYLQVFDNVDEALWKLARSKAETAEKKPSPLRSALAEFPTGG